MKSRVRLTRMPGSVGGLGGRPPRSTRPIELTPQKKAYPSLALDDYVAQVSVFDGWEGRDAPEDRTIYAVRYRRRDGRSGMNVIVDDPVEIYLHSEGPPSDLTNSR